MGVAQGSNWNQIGIKAESVLCMCSVRGEREGDKEIVKRAASLN